jgi:hypothetical protein
MRPINFAVCIIVVGVLAALPFRHTEPAIDLPAPVGIASGPLGKDLGAESISGVMQWPDRPGFDPSIAWQPQPMRLEASSYEWEMPAMPESFPHDSMEVPVPASVRHRYDAVVNMRQAEPEKVPVLVMPPVSHVEDRFIYKPASPRQSSIEATSQGASIHAASVSLSESANESTSSQRHYIREPR